MRTALVLSLMFAAGTCAVASLASAREPQDDKAKPADARPGELPGPVRIEDRLTDADLRDKALTNSAHKVHVLNLKAGQPYQIDLMKKDRNQPLDPYLRIEDSAAKELARDDDSGGDLNARILFTPTRDDNYRIIATCLSGTGEYVLKVTAVALGKVETVGPDGLEMKGRLDKGAPAPLFRVKLAAGKSYTIDMMSTDFDSVLVMRNSAGQEVARDDDSGDNLNARIRHVPARDDTFTFEAHSFNGAGGAFLLKVRQAK